MENPRQEQALFLLKPDGVKKGLIGEVIKRIEQTGLKIVGLKVVRPSKKLIEGHLPNSNEWLIGMGKKTLSDYEAKNIDPLKEMGTADPLELGKQIKEWLLSYLTSDIIVAGVVEGNRAIEIVRKVMGNTIPVNAAAGTVRGDFSTDSPSLANAEKRAIMNITHASGDPTEAAQEIANWFKPEELVDYQQ